MQLLACIMVFAGACVVMYPHAAAWFSQKEQSAVTARAQAVLEQPPNNDAVFREEAIRAAHTYNDALASGALLAAHATVPTGDGSSTDSSLRYDEMLNSTNDGFMGRLRYDALGIDLPIFHGTDSHTLTRGVGHLEGTSLPVGGLGTRSVLTAHRGLPTATLFTNLDQANIGDTLSVSVLNEVLTYTVVDTQVIKPERTESLVADPNRDLITLVTCTPLGINSHRILVTAERMTPTPPDEIAAAAAAPDLPGFPWWIVVCGGLLVVLTAYIYRVGYAPRQAASDTSGVSSR